MKQTLLFLLFFLLTLSSSFAQTEITIEQAREADADGVLVRLDEEVVLEGKAIGPNFRPDGQTFALIDINSGIGITVFSLDSDVGYAVNDYDNLRVTGKLTQFNGLAEIEPTSIEVLAPGGFNPSLPLVSDLDESTESYLVVYKDATLVDPTQWQDSGSFNVDVTNGTTTIQVRIDSDTDITGMPAPTGSFSITGIGGQFDQDAPFDSGYQLFPRSIMDIDPYNPAGTTSIYTRVTMDQIRENDADGVPVMNEDKVEITSTVHGINLRPAGLQFTIINENNVGVGIFSQTEQLSYTVQEGDRITVQGTLGHFNGLTQITPDSITLVSQNNPLVQPREVTQLDESTESSLITFFVGDIVDPAEWLGDGSSFNVNYLDANSSNNMLVRIDSDTYWADQSSPGGAGIIWTGIGGQFDNTAAHDEGYQLLPRYQEDLGFWLSTYDMYQGAVKIFPNPTTAAITISSDQMPQSVEVYGLDGKLLKLASPSSVSLEDLQSGIYMIKVQFDEGAYFQRVIKQ